MKPLRRPGPSRAATALVLVVFLGATGGAAACSGRERPAPTEAEENGGPPLLYVAVGASESVGVGTEQPLRQAWTQVFFRSALPRQATFVNLGIPGATVAGALERQVPEALTLRPDLMTVWLNVNDLVGGVTPGEYEKDLGQLVRRLRRNGATRVLVANTPELDRLPAYLRCQEGLGSVGCGLGARLPAPDLLRAAVAAYNDAIARVASREGAVLVDLHAAGLAARQVGTESTLISEDGFHPSPAGHRAVAAAFADALASAPDGQPR